MKKLNSTWYSLQRNLSKNILNFTISYPYNMPATKDDLLLWSLSSPSDCSLCFLPESLTFLVAGYKMYLRKGRYTWRHNSALKMCTDLFTKSSWIRPYVDLLRSTTLVFLYKTQMSMLRTPNFNTHCFLRVS